MTSSEEPADIEGASRDSWPPFCVQAMNLTPSQWQTVRLAAKYTNGTRVPRAVEIQALKNLQKMVKAIDAQAASSDPSLPKQALSSSG